MKIDYNVRIAINDFLNMSEESRISYISKYPCLLPYEKEALKECLKLMTPKERKLLKNIQSSSAKCEILRNKNE